MSSNINPNNIDGTYPIAGQDNDSQGFRDNFTNTRTNFSFAAAEISDLQSKAVLKAALTGTTLDNNMAGSVLSNAQLRNMSETRIALGSVAGTQSISYAAGPYYTLTAAGSVTLAFSNLPAAGVVARWRVQITVSNISYTVTLPSAVSVGTATLQGYNTNVISFNRTGVYEYEFETNDGGTTISIFDLNRNQDPIYLPSSEDLANAGAASLTNSVSYFSTSALETATLAAGFEGQIKVLVMYLDGGNMVVTVTNCGWKDVLGTGTITFTETGQACTLQYINGRWFCIGNNGAVFA
jgi:hypothetical protein